MGRCKFTRKSPFDWGTPWKVNLTVRRYKRHNFDYIILAIFLIYGLSAAVFIFGKMRFESWVWVFRIGWPCLVITDLFCFLAGWISTWSDVRVILGQ